MPFAIRRPGPSWKTGYPGVAATSLAEKEGEVKHNAQGSLAGALAVLDGPQQSSWHFTIAKDGKIFQHYPLESITWHSGLPGDRKTDTSLIGNLTLIGEEHEGVAGEPLTQAQFDSTLRISQFIRDNCPRVKANPPMLHKNLWEHRELTPTSCPSGRIPWGALIVGLEDDMALDPVADKEEFRKMWMEFWLEIIAKSYPRGLAQIKKDMNKVEEALNRGVEKLGS